MKSITGGRRSDVVGGGGEGVGGEGGGGAGLCEGGEVGGIRVEAGGGPVEAHMIAYQGFGLRYLLDVWLERNFIHQNPLSTCTSITLHMQACLVRDLAEI